MARTVRCIGVGGTVTVRVLWALPIWDQGLFAMKHNCAPRLVSCVGSCDYTASDNIGCVYMPAAHARLFGIYVSVWRLCEHQRRAACTAVTLEANMVPEGNAMHCIEPLLGAWMLCTCAGSIVMQPCGPCLPALRQPWAATAVSASRQLLNGHSVCPLLTTNVLCTNMRLVLLCKLATFKSCAMLLLCCRLRLHNYSLDHRHGRLQTT